MCGQELGLLVDECTLEDSIEDHEVMTALCSPEKRYLATGVKEKQRSSMAFWGRVLSIHRLQKAEEPRTLCWNTGSGKSHTVSVLLESMMVFDYPAIGVCKKPLSGVVLHFSEGGQGALPCEAAWLACPKLDGVSSPTVVVYVSKSSFFTMKKVYAKLGDHISVRPLTFSHSELDAQAILSMMAVGSSDSAPLYMQSILSILRELGERFTYPSFLAKVKDAKEYMNPLQKSSLDQRLALLAAFVDSARGRTEPLFRPGQLTIVDLSDPFIDPSSACSLFEIVTRLFVRADVDTGKVLVVDEAHKYLSASRSDTGLTKALTSLIRQQRHLAMRVIISTQDQEPTAVPPVLIDLCNIAIFHRFSSPAWWDAVAKRVCVNSTSDSGFTEVVKLKTGQALVLCPSGLGMFSPLRKSGAEDVLEDKPTVSHFGRKYLLIKTRKRVTLDGGASRMALDG
ncbi:hypothetical protein BN946_scf184325.g10 [Trametes cinnabarina]|uniref:Zona occludens toxin N-terminal domain-containing protein n=1 Tax=Pycnoporus cinnabarinus TaxID=5643 RepID=A0A060SQ89_PYCCI|nr:hypothetical protein BN946_scf184325.g10 [Trametes cinnabarina]